MQGLYETEWKCAYTPATAMEEASRCLLCLDAPCSQDCPAGTDPGRFIRSIRFLNTEGAAETIRENNPFGAVCARVCPTERYCQRGCSRSGIDRPIDIGGLQRYATDYEAAINLEVMEPGADTGKKVAIVGSGPAGLTAAARLREAGHVVDVFERRSTPGGMLTHGIPAYRLPDDVVAREIDRIVGLGVTITCDFEVTSDDVEGDHCSMRDLLERYDAVLVDPGFQKPFVLPVLKDDPRHVSALEFLDLARTSKGTMDLPANVLVIGGGDVAMDVSTSLKRMGVANVTDVIYEQSCEFLCSQEELRGAQAAGVTLIDGYVPVEAHDGTVTFKHRVLDATLTITADLIIGAVGQRVEVSGLDLDVAMHGNEVATAGPATKDPRVFVTGDIAQGDKTVVWAVRKGKEAAQAIDEFLTKGGE